MITENKSLQILVVEDWGLLDPIWDWIREKSTYEIIGPIRNKNEATSVIEKNKNIALGIIDLKLPMDEQERTNSTNGIYSEERGLSVAIELRDKSIPVILFSEFIFHTAINMALENNFSYLLKYDNPSPQKILQTIEDVFNGNVVFSRGIVSFLFQKFRANTPIDPLDNDQWKLLVLHYSMRSNDDIAKILGYSVAAIKTKNTYLYKKIGAKNVEEARRWFRINANSFSWKKHIESLDSKYLINIDVD